MIKETPRGSKLSHEESEDIDQVLKIMTAAVESA